MLQIISGKFFTTKELNSFDAKSVLFSNYSWIAKIDTVVGSIEPIFSDQAITTAYVFQYQNRIEKEKCHPLVRTGDREITDQYRLLCMFWFRAYFNKEKSMVERYCQHIPSPQPFSFFPVHVSRYFDRHIHGVFTEAEGFPGFVEKVINLDRTSYEQIICSLHHLFHSLELSNLNFDLAYSMLVYILESYAQAFDGFQPTWEGYDSSVKKKLDTVFNIIDPDKVSEIQKILISSSNFKAQQRMLDYVEKKVRPEYFVEEARELKNPIRKSELIPALRNAYTLRSNFAHSLQSVQDELPNVNIGEFDVFRSGGQPYFTFRGLFRLTYSIIKNFISSQPLIEKEIFDYQNHFPGVIRVEMAPKYWIWRTDNFQDMDGIKRLSGLLQELEAAFLHEEPVTDIRDLLKLIEDLYPQAKKKYRPSLFAIYYLSNTIFPEEIRLPESPRFINRYSSIFGSCSIEAIISQMIIGMEWPWDSITCEEIINKYLKDKFSPQSIRIPLFLEISMITELANRFLISGRYSKYSKWLQFAITDLPSHLDLQNYISECMNRDEPISLFQFIRASVLKK